MCVNKFSCSFSQWLQISSSCLSQSLNASELIDAGHVLAPKRGRA